MSIESKFEYNGLEVATGFSRLTDISIRPQDGTVQLTFQEYANAASGAKVFDEETVMSTPDFDPEDEVHVYLYEQAGSPDLKVLDAHGNPWRPAIYTKKSVWRGRTVKQALRSRVVSLSTELALAVAAMKVPGLPTNEKDPTLDNLTSQVYRAAMLTGEFTEPKAV